ncbi:hypothetical protein X759_28620 [Mesorhizobium sp. LSHC420B00]|nr:hypothetical protein X759_28620 [Mesorhizobium sp. LSHC420B00]
MRENWRFSPHQLQSLLLGKAVGSFRPSERTDRTFLTFL